MKIKFYFESIIPKILGVDAITLYPFIFFAKDQTTCLVDFTIQHEMVHVEQVRRLGWFKMYWTYVREYFTYRYKGMSHDQAYTSLSLEKEAYRREREDALLVAYQEEKRKI